MRTPARLTLTAVGTALALSVAALPPASQDPEAMLSGGELVSSIPTADAVQDFTLLDDAHVMLSTPTDQYLLTLNRQCVGLRWARHVGVTASGNTIWAGFDALTADGQACPIREIHRVSDSRTDAL